MNVEVGNRSAARARSLGSALRGAGRVALWALVGLLLVRGVLATAAGPRAETPAQSTREGVGRAEESLAIRFARAYLADPTARSVAGYLAEGARIGSGRPPRRGQEVAQAEVTSIEELGGGRAILTVACELRDSRTLYLAVPTARSRAGGVAALGAPWIVAAPTGAGVLAERPRPLAGEGAGQIAALVERFAPAYVEAQSAGDLSYFLAPGSAIEPLGAGLRFVSVGAVHQFGSGEGARRTVQARIRVEDPASGAVYPLAYRFEVVRGARWYVERVEGALS
ncbi:MAG TPA: conjugal transfer protein [Solirubrobacterales bacterium]|nr:conjugal transfer protein [Solirubrobacterales bacterium]